MRLTLVAVAVSLTAAVALHAKGLTGVVPEAPPVSAPVLALVALVLAGAALVAAYVPTRRATAIAAVDALRHE